ncbi:MAG: IclR family transcriptional regulator [Bradyrhizobiaceae bacterium]|nr:MAG: IclR family transcriptional regulator [Bradyrhizobiaceae bacterium]
MELKSGTTLPSSTTLPPASKGSAVGKVLAVLEYLAASRRSVSVGEISQALQISRSQAHRVVAMMEREEMLTRHPLTNRIMVGTRVARLACRLLAGSPIKPLWHPVLDSLVKDIGATCNFVVYDGSIGTYFDRIEANWPESLRLKFGSKVPLHCTAGGKLYLANLGEQERHAILDGISLTRLTPRTITNRTQLSEALKIIAQEQIGTDEEEFIEGMVAVAVPVFSSADILLGTLAVHSQRSAIDIGNLRGFIPRLNEASASLARIFEREPEIIG